MESPDQESDQESAGWISRKRLPIWPSTGAKWASCADTRQDLRMTTVDQAQGREYDFEILDLVSPGVRFSHLSQSAYPDLGEVLKYLWLSMAADYRRQQRSDSTFSLRTAIECSLPLCIFQVTQLRRRLRLRCLTPGMSTTSINDVLNRIKKKIDMLKVGISNTSNGTWDTVCFTIQKFMLTEQWSCKGKLTLKSRTSGPEVSNATSVHSTSNNNGELKDVLGGHLPYGALNVWHQDFRGSQVAHETPFSSSAQLTIPWPNTRISLWWTQRGCISGWGTFSLILRLESYIAYLEPAREKTLMSGSLLRIYYKGDRSDSSFRLLRHMSQHLIPLPLLKLVFWPSRFQRLHLILRPSLRRSKNLCFLNLIAAMTASRSPSFETSVEQTAWSGGVLRLL